MTLLNCSKADWVWSLSKDTLFEKGITFECIFRRILSLLVYRVTVDILKRNRMNFKDKERDRVSNQTTETERNVYRRLRIR